ncbi:GAP family protein [Streptomyces anulatus]
MTPSVTCSPRPWASRSGDQPPAADRGDPDAGHPRRAHERLRVPLLGARQWKGRPREGHEASTPGWMKAIDTFTPAEAAGLAAALAVANPKNLVLAVGGAVSIASSTATAGGKTVAGVLMVLIASLCALLPLAVYLGGGTKSAKVLGIVSSRSQSGRTPSGGGFLSN